MVLGRTATAELDPDGLMTPDLDLRRDSNHLLQFAADSNSDQTSTADLSVARRIVATILADPQLDQCPTDIYPVELQAHPEGLPPQLAPQDRRFRSVADPEGITGGLGEKPLWLPMGVYEGSANRFAGGRPLPLHTTPTYYSFDIKMPSQYHIDVIDHRLKSGSLLKIAQKNQPEHEQRALWSSHGHWLFGWLAGDPFCIGHVNSDPCYAGCLPMDSALVGTWQLSRFQQTRFITVGLFMSALIVYPLAKKRGSLAAGGSLLAGATSADQITNETPVDTSNTSEFSVFFSIIQVTIGITVGLFMSALIVYPLGKKRDGLAAGGSLLAGVTSADRITNGAPVDASTINNSAFNVLLSVIQVAIGITVGLFLSALMVYPLPPADHEQHPAHEYCGNLKTTFGITPRRSNVGKPYHEQHPG
ncbi:hypothetical protein CcaCcLH18_12946 [Colletotrichum camelliae]|nr:hypothetical protein CcaCcLH18_12946 [Colletotrichum camelliae]